MTDPAGMAGGSSDTPGRSAVILLYHRVTRLGSDPHAIAVNPERFDEHLELIRDRYTPLALSDLVSALETDALPPRAICVTFDDGYADNLDQAAPSLRRAGVPATVFVTTGNLGNAEFWWDQLERIFLAPGTLPRRFRSRFGRRRVHLDLGRAADYHEPEAERHAGWSVRDGPPPTARHHAFETLFRVLQRLDGVTRARALETLHAWADRDTVTRTSHRPLTPEEVATLSEREEITIGAHTVTHPRLSKLRRASRLAEIRDSRTALEELVDGPVTLFAYPFGDFKRAAPLMSEAGMDAALTTRPGVAHARSDSYLLPRVYVGDWSGEQLEREIESHFGGS